jgi:LPXTG-motif cell wall-anchored protein
MTRAKLLMLGIAIAMVSVFATPAAAQDGPSITVEPASVEAAGETEFTITGAGWTAAPPIFVLPCFTVSTPEEITEQGAAACDTAALTPATPADGSFEVTVTYDVPETGMCIAAGDAAQSEAGFACITVGAAAEEEAPAEEGAEEEAAPTDEEAPAEEEELAETGIESGLLAIIGVAVLAAGAMVLTSTRRVGRI